ncbi:MAG: FtsL-like putative cell division protein [Muribaculaceae bacterium]
MAQSSSNKRQTPEKGKTMLKSTVRGLMFSMEFFAKNWKIFLGVILISLLHITNRYLCVTRMEKIIKCEAEAKSINTRALAAKGEYLSNTREKNIKHLMDSVGLNLSPSEKPNKKLHYGEK